MLSYIYQLVAARSGDTPFYFSEAVKVPVSRSTTIRIWAVCASADGELGVMDSDQNWTRLEEREEDAQVMEAVCQRLLEMKKYEGDYQGRAAV